MLYRRDLSAFLLVAALAAGCGDTRPFCGGHAWDKQFPIHLAARMITTDTAADILSRNPDEVNRRTTINKYTPLHVAVRSAYRAGEHTALPVVRFLIKHGADVNACDSSGDTPLCYAAFARHAEIAELLLEGGADPDGSDCETEWSHCSPTAPVNWAASNGDVRLLKLLIKAGADVDISGRNGGLPLNAAIHEEREDTDVMKVLLDAGANVNPKGEDPPPLHVAAMYSHQVIAGMLLDRGADIDAKYRGSTAAERAVWDDRVEMIRFLDRRGATPTPVSAAAMGNLAFLRQALMKDPELIARHRRTGASLLYVARRYGQKEVAAFLIEHGGQVDPD